MASARGGARHADVSLDAKTRFSVPSIHNTQELRQEMTRFLKLLGAPELTMSSRDG